LAKLPRRTVLPENVSVETVYETLRGEAVFFAHGSLVEAAAELLLGAALRSNMVRACRATNEQTRQWW